MEGGHQHRFLAVRHAGDHYVQVREGFQRRFGIIPGITDKGYITNSYTCTSPKIDAFDKLKFESAFPALSTGGAISYVDEVPNMQDT